MRRQLIVVLVLIVVLPMGLLGWLGFRMAGNERELVRRRVSELQAARLRDIDERIQRLLDQRARTLLELTEELPVFDPGHLRRLVRRTPEVEQLFVHGEDGRLLFPPLASGLSESERQFLMRARTIFTERLLWHMEEREQSFLTQSGEVVQGFLQHAPNEPVQEDTQQLVGRQGQQAEPQGQTVAGPEQATSPQMREQRARVPQSLSQSLPESLHLQPTSGYGWYAWYWESGLHLLFWRHDRRGFISGAELSRMRLLADIINELPVAALSPASGPQDTAGTIALFDSRNRVIYQWGDDPVDAAAAPAVQLALSAPLGAWQLRYYQDGPAEIGGSAAMLTGIAAFLAMAGVLIGLSVYLYRESTREWREAHQRVRFVNQVSHELRTPLTNIRLYAELLEQRLIDADERSRSHLQVIVSESHRLSRLIGNVLAFARHRRGQLRLHCTSGVVDDTVSAVVEQFRPSLEGKEMVITLTLAAPQPFRYDADAVEQVLANLLNNVEKYAAAGGRVSITTTQEGDSCVVRMADRGPGVPPDKRQAVFEPFVRLDDRLTEGVAGTGMGLSIAREIAHLHGGDLRLAPSQQGAVFELVLPMADEDKVEQ